MWLCFIDVYVDTGISSETWLSSPSNLTLWRWWVESTRFEIVFCQYLGFPGGSNGSVCLRCGRPGFNPWVREILWRRKWHPLQYFCLDKRGWWATVHGVTESDTTNTNCQHLFIEHIFMESLFHAKYIASSYTESTLCSPWFSSILEVRERKRNSGRFPS